MNEFPSGGSKLSYRGIRHPPSFHSLLKSATHSLATNATEQEEKVQHIQQKITAEWKALSDKLKKEADKIRRKMGHTSSLSSLGVMYEIVSNIPKVSSERASFHRAKDLSSSERTTRQTSSFAYRIVL